MKLHFLGATVLSVAVLTSCGSDNKPLRDSTGKGARAETAFDKEQRLKDSLAKLPAQTMTFAEAIADTMQFDRLVTTEGYLQLPQLSSSNSAGQSMNFFGRRNQTNGNYIYTSVPTGSGKNQMKPLPDKYLPSDLVITDAGGTQFTANERVRLTGRLHSVKSYSDPNDRTAYFDVTNIEKVTEAAIDYSKLDATELSKAESEKEENHDKLYFLEGKLSTPMFILTGNEMTIDLTNKKGDKFTVKLVTGSGNSQMENLKENWDPADVKIRDNKGQLISLKKNVRGYGVLKGDGLHIEELVSQ